MHYREWQPPASLSGYVRYFWMLESDQPETFVFRPIPDGCPGLIFQSDSFFDQEGKKLPGLFLYGQTTRLNELTSAGLFRTFGVYLYPHALRTIFGLRADELTDSCLDLTLRRYRDDSALHEQLKHATAPADWMKVLSDYLLQEIRRHEASLDPGLHQALERLQWAGASLREVREELRLSERTLERKFKEHIGISPKLFSRICRFQSALVQLRQQSFDKLSDIGYEQEYADQSHFIRTFREFSGLTPDEFRRRSAEVVENFPIVRR
ncbi:helix-turn-helix domain-containing protein [Siphonobacter aquaeclarae]|uniref:Transcriptional regulator, AraC family n=1 Tax=Siphonobacter aquaeclarae TaxID=563176 RepID=A0A1G9HZD7_9BACT|nr:helix-turn-helix domain-containing protein [Siphonobacter aquaeclarae]SDL18350.1 transcriptional regulator, AraC family [Siphonobacter aquaeclarae]